MLIGSLTFLLAVMLLFPRTPLACLLHEQLVERPLEWLQTVRRHHLIFVIGLVALSLFAGEMIMLMGSFDLAVMLAWDVSLYVDALLATYTLATLVRSRSAYRMLRMRLPQWVRRHPRSRAPRTAPSRQHSDEASNDDDGIAIAVAA